MLTVILFAALVPLVSWGVHRDIRGAVRRRRMRQLTEPIRRALVDFQVAIGSALLPPMIRAASDMERSMRKVSEAMAANPDALSKLQAMAADLRKRP